MLFFSLCMLMFDGDIILRTVGFVDIVDDEGVSETILVELFFLWLMKLMIFVLMIVRLCLQFMQFLAQTGFLLPGFVSLCFLSWLEFEQAGLLTWANRFVALSKQVCGVEMQFW